MQAHSAAGLGRPVPGPVRAPPSRRLERATAIAREDAQDLPSHRAAGRLPRHVCRKGASGRRLRYCARRGRRSGLPGDAAASRSRPTSAGWPATTGRRWPPPGKRSRGARGDELAPVHGERPLPPSPRSRLGEDTEARSLLARSSQALRDRDCSDLPAVPAPARRGHARLRTQGRRGEALAALRRRRFRAARLGGSGLRRLGARRPGRARGRAAGISTASPGTAARLDRDRRPVRQPSCSRVWPRSPRRGPSWPRARPPRRRSHARRAVAELLAPSGGGASWPGPRRAGPRRRGRGPDGCGGGSPAAPSTSSRRPEPSCGGTAP